MKRFQRARRALRGMTVVELAISTFLLIMLSGSLTAALINVRGVFQQGTIQSRMQDASERVFRSVSQDLRCSGFLTAVGPYPYVFDDGNAIGAFIGHAHAPAVEHALAGDPDFGVNREIVFLRPLLATDAAGDETPTLDASGVLQWDNDEISYVVTTGADGINYLERRTNAANPRRLASHVERIFFDVPSAANNIPTNAVRVQIFFRQVDEKGVVHRHQAEATVALRNTPGI